MKNIRAWLSKNTFLVSRVRALTEARKISTLALLQARVEVRRILGLALLRAAVIKVQTEIAWNTVLNLLTIVRRVQLPRPLVRAYFNEVTKQILPALTMKIRKYSAPTAWGRPGAGFKTQVQGEGKKLYAQPSFGPDKPQLLHDRRTRKLQKKIVKQIFYTRFGLTPGSRDLAVLGSFSSLAWLYRNMLTALGASGFGPPACSQEIQTSGRLTIPEAGKGLEEHTEKPRSLISFSSWGFRIFRLSSIAHNSRAEIVFPVFMQAMRLQLVWQYRQTLQNPGPSSPRNTSKPQHFFGVVLPFLRNRSVLQMRHTLNIRGILHLWHLQRLEKGKKQLLRKYRGIGPNGEILQALYPEEITIEAVRLKDQDNKERVLFRRRCLQAAKIEAALGVYSSSLNLSAGAAANDAVKASKILYSFQRRYLKKLNKTYKSN